MLSKLIDKILEELFFCREDRVITEFDLLKIQIVQILQGIALILLSIIHMTP